MMSLISAGVAESLSQSKPASAGNLKPVIALHFNYPHIIGESQSAPNSSTIKPRPQTHDKRDTAQILSSSVGYLTTLSTSKTADHTIRGGLCLKVFGRK